jgi:transcriptional regulator with XRE-family HTH domain
MSRTFGGLLRAARLRAGLSQAELAALASISAGHVAALETGLRGHRPGRNTVINLAAATGSDLGDMLAAAGHAPPAPGDPVLPAVLAALRQDPVLASEEKAVMEQMYLLLRSRHLLR